MGKARDPEYATALGGLDDAAFTDGSPLSAHVLRQLIRQSNMNASRSTCVYRYTGQKAIGAGVTYVPPFWGFATPQGAVPIRKAPSVRQLRVRIRATVESGRGIWFGVETQDHKFRWEDTLSVIGTGGVQAYDMSVPVSSSADEWLAVYFRAQLDPTTDPVVTSASWSGLSAAAFGDGTWGTPTINPYVDVNGFYYVAAGPNFVHDGYVTAQFGDNGGARGWRIGTSDTNSIARSGLYLWIYDVGASGGGAAYEVRDGSSGWQSGGLAPSIWVHPEIAGWETLFGRSYTLRQLPTAQILSVSAYEQHS